MAGLGPALERATLTSWQGPRGAFCRRFTSNVRLAGHKRAGKSAFPRHAGGSPNRRRSTPSACRSSSAPNRIQGNCDKAAELYWAAVAMAPAEPGSHAATLEVRDRLLQKLSASPAARFRIAESSRIFDSQLACKATSQCPSNNHSVHSSSPASRRRSITRFVARTSAEPAGCCARSCSRFLPHCRRRMLLGHGKNWHWPPTRTANCRPRRGWRKRCEFSKQRT